MERNENDVLARPVVAEVVTKDCAYGFSGYALMSDGTHSFQTGRLHPSRAEAEQEVRAAIALATSANLKEQQQ
jgi:hypothetical protein